MKTGLRLMICTALALAITLIWGAGAANSMTACNASFVTQQANVFTVLPTGTDDADNLQCAFDAAVLAGSGSTVQLVQGTYFIGHEIVGVNFDGSFVGAGKHKTIIQNIDTVPFPILGGPYFFQNWGGLFVFYQDQNGGPSSITISDLTLRARGVAATEWYSLNPLQIYGKYTGLRDDEVSYVNTSLIRVGFEGQKNPAVYGGYNVLNAVLVMGEWVTQPCDGTLCIEYVKQVSGNQLLQDCTFENAVYGYAPVYQQDSHIEVKGSTFKNIRWASIDIGEASNSTIDVQYNTVEDSRNGAGISIINGLQAMVGWELGPYGDLPEPSKVIIAHNKVTASRNADGIGLVDLSYWVGEPKVWDVSISQNQIVLNQNFWGAIYAEGISGLSITNNIVTGVGVYGIYPGIWDDPVTDWVMVGNNLQNVQTEWPKIVLFPSTSNMTVVGGSNSTNVLDLGTNNLVTGVNVTHDAQLGQLIQDAMAARRDLKRTMP